MLISVKIRQCLLAIVASRKDGKKELLALEGGFRESELSWTEVLIDLKHRRLYEIIRIHNQNSCLEQSSSVMMGDIIYT